MSNKDLLKLENEYRHELPHYKEKPNIGPVSKPEKLKGKIADFLQSVKASQDGNVSIKSTNIDAPMDGKKCVEMDIYLTPPSE